MTIQQFKDNMRKNYPLYLAGVCFIVGLAANTISSRRYSQEQDRLLEKIRATSYNFSEEGTRKRIEELYEPSREAFKRFREQNNALWQSAYSNLERQIRMDERHPNPVPSLILTR